MRLRIADCGLRIDLRRRVGALALAACALLLSAGPAHAETCNCAGMTIDSTWEAVLFYIVGGTAAATALGCVLSTNIVRMATCLFGTLGAVAILYFLLSASFLGAIQLIVYAGGTLIVIIFGVMLTSKSPWVKYIPKRVELIAGGVLCLALFTGLSMMFVGTVWGPGQPSPNGYEVAQFGWSLLTTYLVPFELASVLLLAVMIGAAYLARPERGD